MTSWIDTFLRWWPRANDARPEFTKQAGPVGYVSMTGPGIAQWTAHNFEAFAREGFAGNPVGYRAVSMIAEAASVLPWLMYDGEEEIDEHPALSLLKRPNPMQSGAEFIHMLHGHLQVAGSAYVRALSLDGEVRELQLLRPDRVSVVTGGDGWPLGYDYTALGRTVRLPAEGMDGITPILHVKLFNPVDAHAGLSPFQPAAKAIDIHNAANAWSKSLFDNSARPSGALVYAPKAGEPNLSDEQFARLKAELEGNYQGAANAGRPMVLEGGLDWKQIAHSPKDMDHIEAKHSAAREIALAFGIPPMLLGIPGDNTYSNYAEANRVFWRQTVLPLSGRVADAIGSWLLKDESPGLRLTLNADAVEALAHDKEAAWKRIDEASFLTQAEKRAAAGYSPQPQEE